MKNLLRRLVGAYPVHKTHSLVTVLHEEPVSLTGYLHMRECERCEVPADWPAITRPCEGKNYWAQKAKK